MTRSDHYPPIGTIRTCFTEKFGVPRQSMMVSAARGILKLNPDPGYRVALNHLEQFSHVWIIFAFHKHAEMGWRPTIRPPRVEAPRRVGVFASRSPHRPNPIGLSALKLESIDRDAPGGIEIHLSGVDILDGTPVLDIKPYLPFADHIPEAKSGWADAKVKQYSVEFSAESLAALAACQQELPHLKALISQVLEWDPRPVSQRRAMPIESLKTQGKTFGLRLLDFEIQWCVLEKGIHVIDLRPL